MEKINFVNNVTKANAETFNKMQDNIEEGINGITLWTNPNPTSSFAGQVINVSNYDDYSMFEYCFNGNISGQNFINFRALPQEVTTSGMPFGYGFYSGEFVFRNRNMYRSATNQITFGDAFQNGTTNNNLMVPVKIIGYK